jgi:hypothetical protein
MAIEIAPVDIRVDIKQLKRNMVTKIQQFDPPEGLDALP